VNLTYDALGGMIEQTSGTTCLERRYWREMTVLASADAV